MSDFTIGPVRGYRPRIETVPTTARTSGMIAPIEPDPAWRDHAACRNADPDLFFAFGISAWSREATDKAKAICAVCPVIASCRLALEHMQRELPGEVDGVWAGTSAEDRHRDKRQERRRRERERAAAKRAVS